MHWFENNIERGGKSSFNWITETSLLPAEDTTLKEKTYVWMYFYFFEGSTLM